MAAVVAIEDALGAGKPLPALPHVPFPGYVFDDRHPPVVTDQQHKTDHPFDHYNSHIIDAKQNEPEAPVLAPLVRQLNVTAAAFGAFAIDRHDIPSPTCYL